MGNNNSIKEEKKPKAKHPYDYGSVEHDYEVHKNLTAQKSSPTCNKDGVYLKDNY